MSEGFLPRGVQALKSGNQVPAASSLNELAPEFDPEVNQICVGGRLQQLDSFSKAEIHPVVLDSHHQVTRLIIKHFDERLLHPGPDRVFAELRRHVWVLRGRQAIKRHQRECVECQKWRAKPTLLIMADFLSAHGRLLRALRGQDWPSSGEAVGSHLQVPDDQMHSPRPAQQYRHRCILTGIKALHST